MWLSYFHVSGFMYIFVFLGLPPPSPQTVVLPLAAVCALRTTAPVTVAVPTTPAPTAIAPKPPEAAPRSAFDVPPHPCFARKQ